MMSIFESTDISYKLINICGDESQEIQIRDLIKIIGDIYEYNHYNFDNNLQNDGQLIKTSSNKRLKTFKHNNMSTTLKENIKTTIEWFKHNYPNIRK